MKVLVLNCGSSSLKYALIDTHTGEPAVSGKIERLGAGEVAEAIGQVVADLGGTSIDAVGHRVVHGGQRFSDAAILGPEVIAAIEACIPLAPLHNPANLQGIQGAMAAWPDVPHVAVFDTAFHARLPRRAKHYAIPPELAEAHGVYRYGFHGTSHAFVAQQAAQHLGRPLDTLRIVTLHLGNGASACAVECGHSVETSMGLTPLEGLVMGTRSGDIDAGALLYLQRAAGLNSEELEDILNQRSGLAGLSGAGHDLRDIEARAAQGDERARLAIGVFAHRARKYLGAYAATMGGVDAVVLTGGIGENSVTMRRRILQRFEYLGLLIDEDRNGAARVDRQTRVVEISEDHSRVKALVVATDEALMIAQQTARLAAGRATVTSPRPLKVAVSARHIHLTEETFAQLFGAGATPTPYRPLSQPGQFACEERVTLHGPRGSIDGVRLLGPLRPKNQVEISRTDEFKLGVDAPVRMSGHVEGSAPIVVEGPKGKVSLSEGLICAWRHIHMTPEDAKAWGVEQGDEVQVALSGGDRDLIFGDVIVRVSPKYATEMHIDTDEANAAEVGRLAEGALVQVPELSATVERRRPAGL